MTRIQGLRATAPDQTATGRWMLHAEIFHSREVDFARKDITTFEQAAQGIHQKGDEEGPGVARERLFLGVSGTICIFA